jgi:hypothetical protein
MIISLSGRIGSGKDSVADYLVREYGFKRESFAGTLKDAVADIFSWDREMLEGKTAEARAEREVVDKWWADRLNIPHLSPRWVLQYFGTDTCRKHFADDIWMASLENKLNKMKGQDIVISDSRFMNELYTLARAGAKTVHIKRGENPTWWQTAQNAHMNHKAVETMDMLGIHRSEWDWAAYTFDVVLLNDGTLADLYAKAKGLVVLTDLEQASRASNEDQNSPALSYN